MKRFTTTLVGGGKRPYDSWTFLVVPEDLAQGWGRGGPYPVRGRLNGKPFRGTARRGEGVVRMPVPADLRRACGAERGDRVDVALELDPEPRRVEVPRELRTVFEEDPELAALFAALPPAQRRAWAGYVDEAKRPDTRQRRADRARRGIRARTFPSETR